METPALIPRPERTLTNNPALGQHDEALGAIGSLDDLGLELGLDASQCAMKDRPLIGAVGEQFCQEGEEAE